MFDIFLFNITHLDVWFVQAFYGENYFQVLYTLFIELWLWVPFTYFIIRYVVLVLWKDYKNISYKIKQKYILLAIDAPLKNEQSIVAMEQVFVHILGAHQTYNFAEKWWHGYFMLAFSCEIVSIDGFIQLIMRIPEQWRDMVESAIYGQFPDAEITEVEDYVNTVPSVWPNETHDMWGVEWSYDNVGWYPIRTYVEFEDRFNEAFIDPLAALLEAMSRIGKGEQIWLHLVCQPAAVDWARDAEGEINKILGREEVKKPSKLGALVDAPRNLVNEISTQMFESNILGVESDVKDKKEDQFGNIWRMSPGEKDKLEAMQRKISKLAYNVKMRYGYFAEKDVMSKTRGVNSIIGAIKSFNSLGRNGFKPELKKTATKAQYFRVKKRKAYRQTKLTAALKGRSTTVGMPKMTMNTEELATVFHFPSMELRAPMLKRTETVKSEAPINLPFEEQTFEEITAEDNSTVRESDMISGKASLPWEDGEKETPTIDDTSKKSTDNISQVVDASPNGKHFDYDSDYFEERFAVDKKTFMETRPQREEQLRKIEREESATHEIAQDFPQEEKGETIDSLENKFAVGGPNTHVEPELPEYTAEVIDVFQGHRVFDPDDEKKNDTDDPDKPSNLPFV